MSEWWRKLAERLSAKDRRPLQWAVFGGVVSVLLVVSLLSVGMSGDRGDMEPAYDPYASPGEDMEPTNLSSPSDVLTGEDVWLSRSEARMRELEQEVKELRRRLDEEKDRPPAEEDASAGVPAPVNAPAQVPRIGPEPQPPQGPTIQLEPAPMDLPGGGPAPSVAVAPARQVPQGQARPQPQAGVLVVRLRSPETERPKDDRGTYLTVSFTRARLLNGLDAPTGGQAQRNPVPVLLEVMDVTQLPNRFREDFRECFILAGGYGDISSERAYLRLDKLACVDDDGRAIEEAVDGYVTGPDGKVGVRGRLVSKQGQVLAKALLAGIASGIGNSFTQAAMTQTISPLGVTQALDPKKALQAGVFGGVGQALNKLAEFYIRQAEKMYPVVEVASGTEVDVILKSGVRIPHWREDER